MTSSISYAHSMQVRQRLLQERRGLLRELSMSKGSMSTRSVICTTGTTSLDSGIIRGERLDVRFFLYGLLSAGDLIGCVVRFVVHFGAKSTSCQNQGDHEVYDLYGTALTPADRPSQPYVFGEVNKNGSPPLATSSQ